MLLVHVTKHASSVVSHCVPPAVYVSEDGLETSDPFRPVQNQTSLAIVPSDLYNEHRHTSRLHIYQAKAETKNTSLQVQCPGRETAQMDEMMR